MNDATLPSSRIKNFPVAWFSTIMGFTGFAIAWMRAETVYDVGFAPSCVLRWVALGLFVLLAVCYLVKIVRYPQEVLEEFRHPVKQSFGPAISIGMILLSIALRHDAPRLSFWLWSVGTVLHLAFTLYVMSSWIHHTKYEIAHMNPAWFIPVVGNILVPIAGVHHAPVEVSWFFYSVGLFFWPVLTAILFYRLIFHTSLPERFVPTLFIFIAPPAVGFISWHALGGQVDAFAHVLYGVALFFALLLAVQASYFVRLKFFLSWWAYSFPLAALTIATLIRAQEDGSGFYRSLGAVLLALLTLLIVLLLVRTAIAVARREICVEGH